MSGTYQRIVLGLSEREDEGADARIEEFDLESAIRDRPRLPDKLIKARFLHAAVSFDVHVGAMVGGRRRAVDLDAEANGAALGRGQHEVHVAGVKSVADR